MVSLQARTVRKHAEVIGEQAARQLFASRQNPQKAHLRETDLSLMCAVSAELGCQYVEEGALKDLQEAHAKNSAELSMLNELTRAQAARIAELEAALSSRDP